MAERIRKTCETWTRRYERSLPSATSYSSLTCSSHESLLLAIWRCQRTSIVHSSSQFETAAEESSIISGPGYSTLRGSMRPVGVRWSPVLQVRLSINLDAIISCCFLSSALRAMILVSFHETGMRTTVAIGEEVEPFRTKLGYQGSSAARDGVIYCYSRSMSRVGKIYSYYLLMIGSDVHPNVTAPMYIHLVGLLVPAYGVTLARPPATESSHLTSSR
ncbi:hypothetical protein VTN31DRAFT_6998 [Thermomyces dupontii]|uniref:uncharacterized protein n=1 Tax=Talaromyces thermophilus TaxID=28565 RepID=UPI0037434E7F